MVKSWLPRLLLAFPFSVAAADEAATPTGGLHWRCWYDQQAHITCLVDAIPETTPAMVPLSSNVPAVVRTLRLSPGELRGKIVHIPLHTSVPFDMGLASQLARASVCGARPDCSVLFTDRLPPATEIVSLLNRYV